MKRFLALLMAGCIALLAAASPQLLAANAPAFKNGPYRPYGRPSGKADFLGADGREQRVYSRGMKECRNYDGDSARIDTGEGLPTACTEVIKELGYAEIGDIMAGFGFMPKRGFKYWETPYSSYDQDNYDYETARLESRWENRSYEICLEGAGGEYKKSGYTVCAPVPDSSYLVELDNNVWLMVVDANIFRIPEKAKQHYPTFPGLFEGSSNAGYNFMKAYKPHVLDWMGSVVQRAKANGKRLIAVSHFPMTEYYGGIGKDIIALFGKGKMQPGEAPKGLRARYSTAFRGAGLAMNTAGWRDRADVMDADAS